MDRARLESLLRVGESVREGLEKLQRAAEGAMAQIALGKGEEQAKLVLALSTLELVRLDSVMSASDLDLLSTERAWLQRRGASLDAAKLRMRRVRARARGEA